MFSLLLKDLISDFYYRRCNQRKTIPMKVFHIYLGKFCMCTVAVRPRSFSHFVSSPKPLSYVEFHNGIFHCPCRVFTKQVDFHNNDLKKIFHKAVSKIFYTRVSKFNLRARNRSRIMKLAETIEPVADLQLRELRFRRSLRHISCGS